MKKKSNIDHDAISRILMVTLVFVIVLMVTACSTPVPITAKFPEVPDRLLDLVLNYQNLQMNPN